MQVVLPRDADTAVQLNAVLQHARSMFAHIGFRHADRHVRRPANATATSATAARVVARHASNQIFMSA